MHKRFIKKIKNNLGFSLTEMLATVLIMSIVLAGITAGVTTAMRVYRQIKLAANAQTLLSTSITAINMDLQSASVDNKSSTSNVEFYSANRGYRMKFVDYDANGNNDTTYHTIGAQSTENGTDKDAVTVPIVTYKTQTPDLKMTISNVTYNGDYFEYTITVSDAEGTSGSSRFTPLIRTIQVRPAFADAAT